VAEEALAQEGEGIAESSRAVVSAVAAVIAASRRIIARIWRGVVPLRRRAPNSTRLCAVAATSLLAMLSSR
jgi:hypothetical protein